MLDLWHKEPRWPIILPRLGEAAGSEPARTGKAAGTGVNTFNIQLSIALEGINRGENGAGITGALLTSYHDVVLEISATGVVVAV